MARLYGHNMAVNDCLAYVTLQNGSAVGKLVVVNVCATDGNNQPQPAIVSSTAGSYAYMNGIAVNGGNLYITYGWATNPFEVWSTGAGGVAPALQGCVPLFSDAGYTTCGQAPVGREYGIVVWGEPVCAGQVCVRSAELGRCWASGADYRPECADGTGAG